MAGYRSKMMEEINSQRDDGLLLCDITLHSGDHAWPAHRCVLAAASQYFKAMFSSGMRETLDSEVTLENIDPETLNSLLQHIYTGEVPITEDNVWSLIRASDYLQMMHLRELCCNFIEGNLKPSNCLCYCNQAEAMGFRDLHKAAKECALRNFKEASDTDDFRNLSREKLVELVSSDALGVASEADVFTAVFNWFNHQPDTRKEGFHKVLENVRLPLLSPYFLEDRVQQQKNVWTSPECHSLLDEARLYNLLPDRRGQMQGVRTRPRKNAADLVDVIVCAGGYGDSGPLRSVEVFSPATSQWTQLGDLPFAVRGHGAVVTDKNVLYIAGGLLSDGSATNRLLRFDPRLNKWEEMAGMRSARYWHGMASLDGFVYVVGGLVNSSTRLDSVERYNTETGQWEQLPGLNRGTSSQAVLAHGQYIYMAGGFTDRGVSNSVQRFDPGTRSWSELAPMPTARWGSAGCVLNDKLYIIGGSTSLVQCFATNTGQWSRCSPMGAGRYCLGGCDDGLYSTNLVQCYDINTEQWSRCSPMGTGRLYPLGSSAPELPPTAPTVGRHRKCSMCSMFYMCSMYFMCIMCTMCYTSM